MPNSPYSPILSEGNMQSTFYPHQQDFETKRFSIEESGIGCRAPSQKLSSPTPDYRDT